MKEEYYPWGGEFTELNPKSCVAVVLLNIEYIPPENIAIYGSLKTENIGIEKIIANVISNPHIRFLIVCGEEIRGHRPGRSLIALSKNGIDKQNKIINAPGAIPYIENLDIQAIDRFQKQIEIIDLIDDKLKENIDEKIKNCIEKNPKPFGEPYIAIKIIPDAMVSLTDKRALHSKIKIDYMGKIEKRGE